MSVLARKLRFADYFALAFGTMVGRRLAGRRGRLGSPRQAVRRNFRVSLSAEFFCCRWATFYGQWVQRLPDAAGEAAYTAQVFPPSVSYFTGWTMLLAYFIVCPWEAVAVGKLAAYLFPSLNSFELYPSVAIRCFCRACSLGLGLTFFITILNYRGVRASATFQNWSAGTVLVLFLVVVGASAVPVRPRIFIQRSWPTPFIFLVHLYAADRAVLRG